MGNLDKAIQHNSDAVRLKPDFGLAHNNLAVAYFQNKDLKKALIHAQEALTLGYQVHPEFLKQLHQ